MSKTTQSRKWILTINNPEDHGITRDRLVELIGMLTFVYACFAYEISESDTPHIHVYIYSTSPIEFQRLKNMFPMAHIDKARGRHIDNRDYITKSGKWKGTEKETTSVTGSFEEFGTLPEDRPEKEDKKAKLIEMIKSGMTNSEILEEDSYYALQIKNMNEIRQTFLAEKYAEENRDIHVTFVTGATGTGKSRDIFDEHGAKNICRITTYRPGGLVYFDAYTSEDVLVFEEFTGQVSITDMLNYMDIYPLKLPARYQDKQACYTKIYITSNYGLYDLYRREQADHPDQWSAFLRRIHRVIEYRADGSKHEINLDKF